MLGRRSILGFTALLLAGAPFALAGSDDDHRCLGGPAGGAWDLPVGDVPGFVHGALFANDHDSPTLVLEASLRGVHPHEGIIEGALFSPAHPDHGPVFLVRGHWLGDQPGVGQFEAGIFRVHDGDHVHGRRVGRIVGHFEDPPGDAVHNVGIFVGEWRVCLTHD